MQTIHHSTASSSSRYPRTRTRIQTRLLCTALAAAIGLAAAAGTAQAASFTYHGSLQDGAQPAEGNYDLELTLYSAAIGGSVVAGPIGLYAVPVHNGNFSTQLDFGVSGTPASGAWLGVKLRAAGQGDYVALDQRSPLSGNAPDSVCPGAWTIDGNAGNPAGSYLGTADTQDLVLKAGGVAVAKFSAATQASSLSPWGGAVAGGDYAVSLGLGNGAAGNYSLAAGYNGGTAFRGSFVWGDYAGNAIYDTAEDQFVVQANGGVMLNTNTLVYSGDDLVVAARRTSGDSDADLSFKTRDGVNKGRIYVSNSSGIMYLSATNGVRVQNPVLINGTMTSTFSANSDGRIKQDIEPLEGAIDTIQQLRPVTFRYSDEYLAKHPEIADERYYNVIAQEFARVFPDSVHGSGEYLSGAAKTADNEILQVDTYPALITTVAAVQETAQRVQHLEKENATLKAQLDRLSARVDQLTRSQGN